MKLTSLDPVAIKQCEELSTQIRAEIQKSGPIPFARFMEKALYTEKLGYYAKDASLFGASGDFVTAPHISPFFGYSIAIQCHEILSVLGGGAILELGAGSGKLAFDILTQLTTLQSSFSYYYIYEVSAGLKAAQKAWFEKHAPHFLEKIRWLESLDGFELQGVILANEVLDALPAHGFQIQEGKIEERLVDWRDGQFKEVYAEAITPSLVSKVTDIMREYPLPSGYRSEINLNVGPFMQALSPILHKGIILMLDYGYGRKEYYHPDRTMGTLRCFFQHQVHDDPLLYPGFQDISVHVDFTSVMEATDFELAGFTTQGFFLTALGIMDLPATILSETDKINAYQRIKTLIFPNEMGEVIKVLGLARGYSTSLKGFPYPDRRFDL